VITSTDPDEGTVIVDIFGGSPAPEIEVFPNQLFFPVVSPGEAATLQLMVMNIGRVELNIATAIITMSENFVLDPDLNGMAIPANTRQPVSVSYNRPVGGGAGLQQGTLTITSDALEPNNTYIVNLFAYNGPDALPPVADIAVTPGEPYSVGETITLSGAGSTPPEGGTLMSNPYNWVLLGAPSGSEASLSNDYLETTTLVPDLPGTYTVMLTVTASISATVTTQGQTTHNLYVEAL
jgi:hypothetical protein